VGVETGGASGTAAREVVAVEVEAEACTGETETEVDPEVQIGAESFA